uniref:Polyprotein n=1 Tax=Monilinia fusarivirus G TaxID=2592771 RepID=A0A7G3W8T3_9VIRU|nr:polyprotein [Monilinia fusarivirus G]
MNNLKNEFKLKIKEIKGRSDIFAFRFLKSVLFGYVVFEEDEYMWMRGPSSIWIDECKFSHDQPLLAWLITFLCLLYLFLLFLVVVVSPYYIFINIMQMLFAFLVLCSGLNFYIALVILLIMPFIIFCNICIYGIMTFGYSSFDFLDLIRGERGMSGHSNVLSEAVKYTLDFGDDSILPFTKVDAALERLQRLSLHMVENRYGPKIYFFTFWVIVYLNFRFLVYVLKTGMRIFFFLCLCMQFSFLTFVLSKPFSLFSVAFWITHYLLKFASICMKLLKAISVVNVKFFMMKIRSKFTIYSSDYIVHLDISYYLEMLFSAVLYVFGVKRRTDIDPFTFCKIARAIVSIRIFRFLLECRILVSKEHYFSMEAGRFPSLKSVVMSTALQVTNMVNDLDPPSFIRTMATKSSLKDLKESCDILASLGYPVDPDLKFTEPKEIPGAKVDFVNWVFSGSNWELGLKQMNTYLGEEILKLSKPLKVYKRSDSYVTVQNELESIARYFLEKDVAIENFDTAVDETWNLISVHFKNSKIVPLSKIFKAWNKKYNVGFVATSEKKTKLGKKRKMKRTEDIGRFKNVSAYLKYWKSLYAHFPVLTMISTAFYKSEALPEKKWKANKLRTPISSFLPQYLFSMVWSYEPNHRVFPFEVPSKVGMPLNGFFLTKVFSEHAQFDSHYAGDMTEFDSSISGNLQNAVKEIRKRGFSHHKEYETICNMIDISYASLEKSLLMTPSTGNIYKKGSGLTTGHASTSADNSIVTTFLYMAAWVELTGLSAKEFKFFNKLSCYGDDHLISTKDTAPSAWTFENVQKVMKRWGITMKDEVPMVPSKNDPDVMVKRDAKDLYHLPFLSKFCRKPTAVDVNEWKTIFGHSAPDMIVYHDPVSLEGKMKAPVLSRDPSYKITRLISMLGLTAHNPKLYAEGVFMINFLIEKNPNCKKFRNKIPSYGDVVRNFYKETVTFKDVDATPEDEDRIITYGEMSSLDYLLNYFSIIPDVLNPKLQSSGFAKSAQTALGPLLRWPMELIVKSNGVLTDAHLQKLASITPYNFIINQSVPTLQTGPLSLLVRHWIYMKFKSDSKSFSIFAFLDWFQMKFANLGFILNAKILNAYPSYEFPIWNLGLIAILNLVELPDFMIETDHFSFSLSDTVFSVPVFDMGYWLHYFYHLAIQTVWSNVPPNFKNLDESLQPKNFNRIFVVQAPTGSGKSTGMILHLQQRIKPYFKKMILIQPRSKVVKNLVPYLQKIGVSASGLTSGLQLDKREYVWVMTAQELLINMDMITPEHYFVLDECHVDEDAYDVLKEILRESGVSCLFASATPTEKERNMGLVIPLDLPNIYTVVEKEIQGKLGFIKGRVDWLTGYYNVIQSVISEHTLLETYLIFVPDKKDVDFLCARLPGACLAVTADSEGIIEKGFQFYVTTAVADVALTIPGVSIVITPNFTREIKREADGLTTPIYSLLGPEVITQRRGRTGRTNHGKFYMVLFDPAYQNFITEDYQRPDFSRIMDWLENGLDLRTLAYFKPHWFRDADNRTLSTEQVLELHELLLRKDRFSSYRALKRANFLETVSSELDSTIIRLRGNTGRALGFCFDTLKNSRHFLILMNDLFYELGFSSMEGTDTDIPEDVWQEPVYPGHDLSKLDPDFRYKVCTQDRTRDIFEQIMNLIPV